MTTVSPEPIGTEDEFALLTENAIELGLAADAVPPVRRVDTHVEGRVVSALLWGDKSPQIVFLHGGGQNAHTWDSVLLHLNVPALAIDLPGHGYSSWRDDRDYMAWTAAEAVVPVLRRWAPDARTVVGMSLGGLTTVRLTALVPEFVRRAVVVDVTPSVHLRHRRMTQAQRGTTALINGARTFPDREDMVRQAIAAAPQRSPAALRRGVRHNSRPSAGGGFEWRYDVLSEGPSDSSALWEDVSASSARFTLVRGGDSVLVSDDDTAEFLRRSASTVVLTVPEAGHSVQSDRPRELAEIVRGVLET
ncbi:alpha/beta fold hydrolase [Rhodococcus koreensis]|uniref:alpha/beta fold hydrolase n=1 Tax=Rhodococcus koreensis TaxID=99653 RepID=UPI0036D7B0D8